MGECGQKCSEIGEDFVQNNKNQLTEYYSVSWFCV